MFLLLVAALIVLGPSNTLSQGFPADKVDPVLHARSRQLAGQQTAPAYSGAD